MQSYEPRRKPSKMVVRWGMEIERLYNDEEILEEWSRVTDQHDLFGVGAVRTESDGPWQWTVLVSIMEFVREEPLESQLRTAIDAALRSVSGVTDVEEEDREVWIIDGTPIGPSLVEAVATAIDALAPEIAAYYNDLDTD
jgi:hypothetical protein